MNKNRFSIRFMLKICMIMLVLIIGASINTVVSYSVVAESAEQTCLHENVNDNLYCQDCGKKMIVKVVRDTNVSYYDFFSTAISNILDNDTIVALDDINLLKDPTTDFPINKNVTFDINGKSINGYYIGFNSAIKVTNSSSDVGKFNLNIIAGADVIFDETNVATSASIMCTGGSLKMYAGIIYSSTCYNGITVASFLPKGYTFVQLGESQHTMTWEEVVANKTTSNIKIIECKHESFNDDNVCVYCNSTIGETINQTKEKLEKARIALIESINTKADDKTINQKLLELVEAINSAETASKTFASNADENMSAVLKANIVSAKEEAMSKANDELTKAVNKLEESLSKKASIEELQQKIDNLETSINNAQVVSKTFASDADVNLYNQLNTNILSAKQEATNANAELSNKIDILEKKLNNTEKDLKKLETAFIVCITLLFLSCVAIVVMQVVNQKRKNFKD